ncbi:MAG: serine/threonine-protein kinase [Kofleriaceae bacterium]
MTGCLDDAVLLELIHGQLAPATLRDVDLHLDRCDGCRELVALAARGSDGHDAPASDALRPGDAIGRYLVLDRLGAGAMGVVYAAHDRELDRQVALKLVRPDAVGAAAAGAVLAAGTDPARASVLREAQAMARLQHPNVVTVHDVGTDGDRVFVAMELVAGATLRAWAVGRPWRERLACLVAVGRGLAAAHAAGVIHRDVKPDNVIVDDAGRPRLGDFGLARAEAAPAASGGGALATTLTQVGAVIGTPVYMAPEQLRGEPATAASDQFALAVTAWECLFGARPFAGHDLAALRDAIARGPSAPERRGVPAAVERALRTALAPAPGARHASVAALVAAIDLRPRRRWLWLAPAVAAAAAATVVMAVRAPAAPPDPCRTAADALAPTWSAAVATALATRLTTPEHRAALAKLDAWAGRWRVARRDVCEAGRVRGEASAALVDVRSACLARGRGELAALVATVGATDADALTDLGAAVGALTDPDACATSPALALLAPVPVAQRAAVAEVERAAAVLQARLVTAAAIAPADGAALVAAATATGHAPTIATAHLVHAALLRRAGQAVAGDRAARDAVVAAVGGHDDLGAARAWIERVGAAGDRRDLDAVDEWAQLATAAVKRVDDPPALVARLQHDIGLLAMNRGELTRARAELTRALSARQTLAAGRPDLDVARTLSALGHVARLSDELDQAEELFRQAIAIEAQVVSPASPELTRDHHNLAGVLRLQGRLDEAEAAYRHTLDLRLATLGPDHPDVGLSHNSLGLVALERGRYDVAAVELAEARRVLAAVDHGELPAVLANLGLLAVEQHRYAAALPLLADAIDRYRVTLPARHARLTRALLDATRAALGLGDRAGAARSLAAARAAIPAEAGLPFVREADELAATLAAVATPRRAPRAGHASHNRHAARVIGRRRASGRHLRLGPELAVTEAARPRQPGAGRLGCRTVRPPCSLPR